jgi:hypothetical protein
MILEYSGGLKRILWDLKKDRDGIVGGGGSSGPSALSSEIKVMLGGDLKGLYGEAFDLDSRASFLNKPSEYFG